MGTSLTGGGKGSWRKIRRQGGTSGPARSAPASSARARAEHREKTPRRTLEGDSVLLDRLDSLLRDLALAVDKDRGDVDLLPLDGGLCESKSDVSSQPSPCQHARARSTGEWAHLSSLEDVLDGLSNLGSDTWARGAPSAVWTGASKKPVERQGSGVVAHRLRG